MGKDEFKQFFSDACDAGMSPDKAYYQAAARCDAAYQPPLWEEEPTDEADVWDDDSIPVNLYGEVEEGSEYEDA